MKEVGVDSAELVPLGKKHSTSQDYDHISILMHTQAQFDHFPLIEK